LATWNRGTVTNIVTFCRENH